MFKRQHLQAFNWKMTVNRKENFCGNVQSSMVNLHLEDWVEKMHISKYFVIIKPPVTQMLHKYYFIVLWPF